MPTPGGRITPTRDTTIDIRANATVRESPEPHSGPCTKYALGTVPQLGSVAHVISFGR